MIYRIEAADSEGKVKTFVHEVVSEDAKGAIEQFLEQNKAALISYRKDYLNTLLTLFFSSKKFTYIQVSNFFQEIKDEIESGNTVLNALEVFETAGDTKKEKQVAKEVSDMYKKGSSFPEALRMTNAFPEMAVSLIAVGSESGNMAEVCENLAESYRKKDASAGTIKKALILPGLTFVAITGLALLLSFFVIPNIVIAFPQNIDLPLVTKIVIGGSDILREYGLYLIGLLIIGFIVAKKSDSVVLNYNLKLIGYKMPVLGKIFKEGDIGDFLLNISLLMRSGEKIVDCLKKINRSMPKSVLSKKLNGIIHDMQAGITFSQALKDDQFFPKKLSLRVKRGESRGELQRTCQRVGERYHRDVDSKVSVLEKTLEPLIIVLLAGLLGIVMMALMLPLYNNFG